MQALRTTRALLTATTLALASIGSVPAAVASVSAQPAANVTYDSNALHTTIVGRFGYDCCNNPVAWGKKSQYALSGGCFPCTPPPI